MRKSLVVLAIFSTISVPAAAQTAPAANQAQPARPQTVKKVVCQRVDDEEDHRLAARLRPQGVQDGRSPRPRRTASSQQAPLRTARRGTTSNLVKVHAGRRQRH